jgi:hypothetical protein
LLNNGGDNDVISLAMLITKIGLAAGRRESLLSGGFAFKDTLCPLPG